jgi:polyisoprenoid-binding protein YceI
MKPVRLLMLAPLFALGLAHAAQYKADPAASNVTAVFRQMNVPVEAKFKTFSAQLDYDAAHPEQARAQVAVDTASLDLGDPEYNGEVGKKEWFNAAQFPKATFVSTGIKPAGDGKLTVSGKLTIKGRALDVSFPVVARLEAGRQVFEGQLPIRRLAFGVGEGEWKDTSIVADEVVIKFRVTAAK